MSKINTKTHIQTVDEKFKDLENLVRRKKREVEINRKVQKLAQSIMDNPPFMPNSSV